MLIKTRVVGEVANSAILDSHSKELINEMCKQAFYEALDKIESNPAMFSFTSLFNPMKNSTEITVDCAINVEPGNFSVDTEEE